MGTLNVGTQAGFVKNYLQARSAFRIADLKSAMQVTSRAAFMEKDRYRTQKRFFQNDTGLSVYSLFDLCDQASVGHLDVGGFAPITLMLRVLGIFRHIRRALEK